MSQLIPPKGNMENSEAHFKSWEKSLISTKESTSHSGTDLVRSKDVEKTTCGV